MSKKGLGKGLDALIPTEKPLKEVKSPGNVEIHRIRPNKSQPRKNFDEDALNDLAASIKENGLIQPIVVRKKADHFEIIAGERRWRAAQKAGVEKLPVVIKEVSDLDVLQLALIENLQREDLNPIEEAEAYSQLIDDFSLTHEEISRKIGKDRSTITNQLRLLQLTKKAQNALIEKKITAGHARALLGLADKNLINSTLNQIVKKNLSVRKVEEIIKKINSGKYKKFSSTNKKIETSNNDLYMDELVEEMTRGLGTKVNITSSGGRGKIEIQYYSVEELERLIGMILGNR